MLETNQIHLGDCLELMHQIPDQSIDMVLCDLPYGQTACAWDSIIDLDLLWEHYKRIIKPRGAIVLTASQPFTTTLINGGGLDWFKYEWIWDKKMVANFGSVNFQPLRQHETVLIFGNGVGVYNPQYRKDVKSPFGRLRGETETPTGKFGTDFKHGVGYPKTILSIPRPNNLTGGGLHPTQKPVALFAYLIRTYTNPGDLVLDNAAGSGTTAIAAIDTGRNWLLIEKDPEYYQIAKDRITERLKQPFLPGLGGTAHNKQLHPNCYPSAPEQLSFVDGPEDD